MLNTAALQLPGPRTPLYPLIQQQVVEEARPLAERLQTWRIMDSDHGLSTTDFHGKPVRYRGVSFKGSPRTVFWANFFEPFIVHAARQSVEWVIHCCRDRSLDPGQYLAETKSLLDVLIERVYEEMVRIDQVLQGQGRPTSVTRVDVSHKVQVMKEGVDDLIVALTHSGTAPSTPSDKERVSHRMVDVFVSHSSHDVALAAQVVDLLRAALNLRAESIRCTSVDGYRLPAGADSDEQLRDEALACRALIVILSAFSLASAYVLFERGARWGAKRPLIPLLAPGIGPQALKGPLAGLNALNCENAAQLHQLVSDVAAILNVQPANPAVFQRHIEAILYASHPTEALVQAAPPTVASHLKTSEADIESPPRADDYSDGEQVIKRHCQREWPTDYSMRNYCVKQQRDALAILKRGCPPDIPADVFAEVRARCAEEWPDDYSMRAYSEQQQLDAYRELERDSE